MSLWRRRRRRCCCCAMRLPNSRPSTRFRMPPRCKQAEQPCGANTKAAVCVFEIMQISQSSPFHIHEPTWKWTCHFCGRLALRWAATAMFLYANLAQSSDTNPHKQRLAYHLTTTKTSRHPLCGSTQFHFHSKLYPSTLTSKLIGIAHIRL